MEEEIKLGKYQIIKELGRGGFGIVYEAKDLVLDRHVALKVLHGQLTVDPLFLERFEQEAKLAAKLEHPNLVPVYDFGQAKGFNFIAMGLMTGGSLKDHFEKHGALDPWRAKKVLEDVLNGLVVIHENGIVHRDLKPTNILFDQYGVGRLSDLGFAKALHSDLSHSSRGGIVGTAAYMAPEVWYGKETSPLSDIYSLGCIIYEMLTGNALFDADTAAESMTKHLITGPVFTEKLHKPWQMLIEKCLAKDPAERYQTAKAVLEDLKFGLLDAAEERQSEIVLSSQDDEPAEDVPRAVEEELSTPESGVSYIPAQGAGSVESTYGKYEDYGYGALEKEALRAGKEAQRSTPVRYIQPAPDALTPGQMLELSPFKRLRIRLPWLLPLSLGVVITLLAVVLFNIVQKNHAQQYIAKATETPTRSYTVQPSPTKVPTNTPIPTNTPRPTKTNTPTNTPPPALGVGSTLVREKDGMEMVYVPEGTFTMGSNNVDYEKPAREVYLDAYWIDKYEVSNAQYKICVEAGECNEPQSTDRYNNSNYANHPVVNVDWHQASAYCEWAGGRLPTEAEWEKAARGPNGNKYPWGNDSPSCSLVNYGGCIDDTTVVGSYPAGASYYGAMDMAGNVWEWVNDWWSGRYDISVTR
ncbi:MAG TPA: bifunctional serine/threonine-protein kinase/formylglycine-generating enzyme family protein, partial [Anaerolineaceae bacterium]|nr:bifunctional serine/threonine-protein kinase/formylglycine-generating enzyme family protein [Anaerolineaceae bacterium]